MAEASLSHCNYSNWQFVDPLDGEAFDLETGFIGTGELHQYQHGFNAGDVSVRPSEQLGPVNFWERESVGNIAARPLGNYPFDISEHMHKTGLSQNMIPTHHGDVSGSGFLGSPMNKHQLPNADGFHLRLDDFLPSTSQLAAERALYMTVPAITSSSSSPFDSLPSPNSFITNFPMPHSPFDDPCSSPRTSYTSYADTNEDHPLDVGYLDFYSLPNTAAPAPAACEKLNFPDPAEYGMQCGFSPDQAVHVAAPVPVPGPNSESESDCLTPLEMPDGTMRFTANWLPVDPGGGFTIGTETAQGAFF